MDRRAFFSATTDAEGTLSINGVPPGAYEIKVLPPAVFSELGMSGGFDIKDPRACQVQDFWLHYAGRIVGTVLEASGQPAAGVQRGNCPVRRAGGAPGDPPFTHRRQRPVRAPGHSTGLVCRRGRIDARDGRDRLRPHRAATRSRSEGEIGSTQASCASRSRRAATSSREWRLMYATGGPVARAFRAS